MTITEILNQVHLGNSVQNWLLAAVAIFLVLLLLPLIHAWLKRNRPIFLAKDNPVAQLLTVLIERTRPVARLVASLYVGQLFLVFPPVITAAFNYIIIVGIWFQAAVWASATLRFFVERRRPVDIDNDGDVDPSPAINVMVFLGQVAIWSIVFLVALANLGVNITGLLAGLGIGGIAVALAVQAILGDLLSSLSIALDKPFMVDDLLRVNDVEGRVEYVGVRSTRLRSINGEQIIWPNGDLSKSRIHNLGRMSERRVVMRLNIQYEATPDQVGQVTQLVEEAVRARAEARFVSCLLATLGSYALEFELIYFVPYGDRVEWMRTVDAVNRGIFERLAGAGIKIAYPIGRQVNIPENPLTPATGETG
jgi:small-conductance mechanosensitive channel